MASLAAHAAWHMGQWEEMANYTNEMHSVNSSTGTFLNAVLAVHNQNLEAAKGEQISYLTVLCDTVAQIFKSATLFSSFFHFHQSLTLLTQTEIGWT